MICEQVITRSEILSMVIMLIADSVLHGSEVDRNVRCVGDLLSELANASMS